MAAGGHLAGDRLGGKPGPKVSALEITTRGVAESGSPRHRLSKGTWERNEEGDPGGHYLGQLEPCGPEETRYPRGTGVVSSHRTRT